jgi:hypothetical protein
MSTFQHALWNMDLYTASGHVSVVHVGSTPAARVAFTWLTDMSLLLLVQVSVDAGWQLGELEASCALGLLYESSSTRRPELAIACHERCLQLAQQLQRHQDEATAHAQLVQVGASGCCNGKLLQAHFMHHLLHASVFI